MSDIRETLDQLDRRLGELRLQVAELVEDPQPAEPLAPFPEWRFSAVPPQPDPTGPPPELPADPDPAPQPGATPTRPHRPKGLDFLFGKAAPAPPPTPAPTEPAAPASPPPDRDPGQVSGQIQELMAVREQLLSGARDLVRAYERQLDLLEIAAATGLPTSPEAVTTPTATGLPTSPEAVTITTAPAPVAHERQEDARPVFFDGEVELVVSGANRIQTIQVLEDSLSRARNVDEVYVRRCHRGQVWLELSLSAGAELLGELNRVLPFPFAVSSATAKEIAITLEAEQ